MANSNALNPDEQGTGAFECLRCNTALEPGEVSVSYLGSSFPVNLLRCPRCGFVLVTEELAVGRMLRVEKTLEDK